MDAFHRGKVLNDIHIDVSASEVTFFRVIHLLVERCNDVLSSLLFLFLICCGVSQIMSAVTIIRQSSSINIFMICFFAAVVFQTFFVYVVLYGLAGDVYRSSKSTIVKLKRQANLHLGGLHKRKERRYRVMFLESCQVQNVRFGLSNFIEKTTPPMFQLYCLNRIVDLLLVRK